MGLDRKMNVSRGVKIGILPCNKNDFACCNLCFQMSSKILSCLCVLIFQEALRSPQGNYQKFHHGTLATSSYQIPDFSCQSTLGLVITLSCESQSGYAAGSCLSMLSSYFGMSHWTFIFSCSQNRKINLEFVITFQKLTVVLGVDILCLQSTQISPSRLCSVFGGGKKVVFEQNSLYKLPLNR